LKLTRTEQNQTKRTHCRRQQQIDAKSESNTKSCVLSVNFGDNGCENAVSIEPDGGREKHFSQTILVGFHA
jgi:hypothetical protein